MGKFFRLSIGDLDTALRLAPNSLVAYRQLIDLATSQGNPAASRRFLDRGLALQPYSFVLRQAHMYNLLPRWNGSYEAMAEFAAESAPYAKRNPRIRSLGGFVDWDKGRLAEAAGRSGDAIEAYQRALQFGDLSQFLYERGTFYSAGERYPEALEDLNSALLQFPQDADALNARSRAEYELGREASGEASDRYYIQAFRDVALAAALKPTDHNIQDHLAFIRRNIPEFTPETPQ
jgi:tetratricopeptide (TPR) repeat protein